MNVGPAGPGDATGVVGIPAVGGDVGIDCVGGTAEGDPEGEYGSTLVAPLSETLSVHALPLQ